MKLQLILMAAGAALASPAIAESHMPAADAELAAPTGDAAAGEKEFRKCKACHAIVDDTGEAIVKGGKVGPNLWGVVGRQAGTAEDYNYGASLVEAGEKGLIWDEAHFAQFVADPKAFLVDYLDDSGARSKMSFKLKKGAEDVYAYLASVGPTPEMMDGDKMPEPGTTAAPKTGN